jgi:hypothetical protein
MRISVIRRAIHSVSDEARIDMFGEILRSDFLARCVVATFFQGVAAHLIGGDAGGKVSAWKKVSNDRR